MNPSNPTSYQALINQLAAANGLVVKAFNSKSSQNLQFIILNDTIHFVPYDRALLWRVTGHSPTLLGASGQTTFTSNSETVNRLKGVISEIKNPAQVQVLNAESFAKTNEGWVQLHEHNATSVLWAPILVQDNEIIGLWLEKWDDPQGSIFKDRIKTMEDYLLPGYAAGWKKYVSKINTSHLYSYLTKRNISYAAALLLAFLLLVRVPLRVAAPCEVVSQAPYLITAPLEGIIEKVDVKPGQQVKIGDVLYTYDARIPLQELKIAEKQVEISKSELQRVVAAGYGEDKSLAELTSLRIKLEKAQLDLDYTKIKTTLLIGKAPVPGIAEINNPDDWRGKPVKVGEKILTISDPAKTKLKIWIPENDNIDIDKGTPIKIFLNPNPEQSLYAKISYISSETVITEKRIPSFTIEAEWENPSKTQAKLGSKGTAIIYGEKVSLFYYIFRKPLATIRNLLSI